MEIMYLHGPAPLYTNSYIALDGEGAAVVIDPAAGAGQYREILEKKGAKLAAILLTHGHYDHVGAVRALRRETGAPVYLGRGDAAGSEIFPLGEQDVDGWYADGETLAFGGMRFAVTATPGHSQGCVCLLCGDVLFTGDTLFAGDIGRTDLAGGSMADMRKSLAKLAALAGAQPDVQVLPGHGPFSTLGDEAQSNPYLMAARG